MSNLAPEMAFWAAGVDGIYRKYDLDLSPARALADCIRSKIDAFFSGNEQLKPGTLIYGPPGVGKTGLLVGGVKEFLRFKFKRLAIYEKIAVCSEKSRRAFSDIDMLEYIDCLYKEWFALNTLKAEYAPALVRISCLAIDTIDSTNLTLAREALMLMLVERAYAGRLTFFACNASLDELAERVGHRVFDRLTDDRYYDIFHVEGRSRRNNG